MNLLPILRRTIEDELSEYIVMAFAEIIAVQPMGVRKFGRYLLHTFYIPAKSAKPTDEVINNS